MSKLSDFRAAPGGGGGGGGSGIKGTWNVTPTYTPPVFNLPSFVEPLMPQQNFASFSVTGDSVSLTSSFGVSAAPGEIKSAGRNNEPIA